MTTAHRAPDAAVLMQPSPACRASSDGWEEAGEVDAAEHAAACALEPGGGPLAAGRPHADGRPAPPSIDVRARNACQPQHCLRPPCRQHPYRHCAAPAKPEMLALGCEAPVTLLTPDACSLLKPAHPGDALRCAADHARARPGAAGGPERLFRRRGGAAGARGRAGAGPAACWACAAGGPVASGGGGLRGRTGGGAGGLGACVGGARAARLGGRAAGRPGWARAACEPRRGGGPGAAPGAGDRGG
jgi:hypothetical protein